MKICMIGTGYVGLVSGVCFADSGNEVWCVDINEGKIAALKEGEIPIYEPGLKELLDRSVKENRLHFTASLQEGLKEADFCFICVDTPPSEDGSADLSRVLTAAGQIGQVLEHYTIVATKSTVPVGTSFKIKEAISEALLKRGKEPATLFDVASNPEFLKEGDAVSDFMKPDRVVVGSEKEAVAEKLHELYRPFMRKQDRFIAMDIASSELTKYAANAMLATRISFMNSLAQLSEKVGADIRKIREGLATDPRIGPDFLFPGLGYGGSCFPKDVEAISSLGQENGICLHVIEATEKVNQEQKGWFFNKIVDYFGSKESLNGKRIAIWGLAFKPETDDIRCAPSLYFIDRFLELGVDVVAYDPVASENVRAIYGNRIQFAGNAYQALEGADALLLCTEWKEFRSPDFEKMKKMMNGNVIFDGRNVYSKMTAPFICKRVG